MIIIDGEIWMSPDEFGNYLKEEIKRMYYSAKAMKNQRPDWQGMERSRVGDVGAYTIFIICEDVERVPHFHIMDTVSYSNPNKGLCNFHLCLEIMRPRLLYHAGVNAPDIIGSECMQDLVDFLKAKKKDSHSTNWQYLLDLWNDNNEEKVDNKMPVPDYKILVSDSAV